MRFRWLLCVLAAAAVSPVESSAADMKLTVGRSVVIDCPAEVTRLAISNPEVADAVAVSSREVLVNAKAQGTATLVVWPKTGARMLVSISVEQNLDPLRDLLRQTFQDQEIRVEAARDAISLNGAVPSQAMADKAAALAAPFAKAVVSNLRIAPGGPEKQILLRVKFAELNRNASTSFGVNLFSTGAGNTPGVTGTGQFTAVRPTELQGTIPGRAAGTTTTFTISDVLNVFAFRPDLNLGAFIKALQGKGLLQTLAEPNLVATNGKDASFLVGGEFPVPIVQGGVNAGAVTIIFKEYGIRLTFQPNLTEHGTIRMYVKPEVSTIDLSNAVLYSGFTIPALATRRMETHIELASGQSFLIAGLLDERVTETMLRVPGLSSVPLLGTIFKSREEHKTATELIVMVTPELSAPVDRSAVQPLPPPPKPFLEPQLVGPSGTPPAKGATQAAPDRNGRRR